MNKFHFLFCFSITFICLFSTFYDFDFFFHLVLSFSLLLNKLRIRANHHRIRINSYVLYAIHKRDLKGMHNDVRRGSFQEFTEFVYEDHHHRHQQQRAAAVTAAAKWQQWQNHIRYIHFRLCNWHTTHWPHRGKVVTQIPAGPLTYPLCLGLSLSNFSV